MAYRSMMDPLRFGEWKNLVKLPASVSAKQMISNGWVETVAKEKRPKSK
jgi:hypothetical protein